MYRKVIIIGLVIAIGAVIAVALFSLGNEGSMALTMSWQRSGAVNRTVSVSCSNVVRDFFELKYPLERRAGFHISCSNSAAIFVLATGVQILTDSGWQRYSEEPRNEIWRLQPGTTRDMFVEIPEKQSEDTWRAYIRYAPEMHGPSLLMVQVREAWKTRSFANWTGTAWGGGRFSGKRELFSQEFSK